VKKLQKNFRLSWDDKRIQDNNTSTFGVDDNRVDFNSRNVAPQSDGKS
jgi:hypothetical protein